jgi:hypothetical protein
MFDFGCQKLNRHRQPRRGENLFVDPLQDFLGRHVYADSLAKNPKEVGLFDVFFAIEEFPG